jgi:hypothetical protein
MFEIRGLDEAMRKLERLQRNTEQLDGPHDVSTSELFTPEFMQRYTKVTSWHALVEAAGFKIESQADFEAIPEAQWETVIRLHTQFSSLREMTERAGAEYFNKKLMEGV